MAPESLVVLAHGLRLVVSTQREEDQAFRCRVFEANVREEETQAYRVISEGFESVTCLEAQTGAYDYAQRVYPDFANSDEKATVFDLERAGNEPVSVARVKAGRMITNEEY